MHLTSPIEIYLLLFCFLWDVEAPWVTNMLTVRNRWKSGWWGDERYCDSGYATGFQLKVEPYQGPFHDDSSLNGIRLRCSDGTLIEEDGKYGEWSFEQSCWSGFLTQFSLRMTNYILPRDNTAANNIKFKCTDGWELEGTGHKWGYYTEWSQSCTGVGICGFQTKKDSKLFFWDRTGLNDVRFFCCR